MLLPLALMMPIDESRLVHPREGTVQLELDVGILQRLLHERGIVLEEVRFLNPSSKRAGCAALKQALICHSSEQVASTKAAEQLPLIRRQ